METRKKLSLAKEFGPFVDRLGAEKEDVIQSYIFLIREEEDAEKVVENWTGI